MQPAYGGYQPYTAQAPYPGQYYAPAGYTNGYPNGGTYPDPAAAYPAWQNAPQMAPATGQTPMARPQQLYDPQMPQRQPSNSGGTPMPRPKTLNTKTKPALKSAMKTPSRSVSDPMGFGHRPRTQSDPHGTLKQFARARTNSVTARDIPGMRTRSFHLAPAHVHLRSSVLLDRWDERTPSTKRQAAAAQRFEAVDWNYVASWDRVGDNGSKPFMARQICQSPLEQRWNGRDNVWNIRLSWMQVLHVDLCEGYCGC